MLQGGGSCKHPPGVTNIMGAGVRHSHSMRDQTSHMREKYQQHRRLSIRTPNGSNNNTPKVRHAANCLRCIIMKEGMTQSHH